MQDQYSRTQLLLGAEAMEKLIFNPQLARNMGMRGHERFMKNYTAHQFETNLLNILQNI